MVTKRIPILMHLDPDKADQLKKLAADTRIARSVLLREAIDDLLAKHSRRTSRGKKRTELKP